MAPAIAEKRTAANPPAEPPIDKRDAAEKVLAEVVLPEVLAEAVPAEPVVTGEVADGVTMLLEKPRVLETVTEGVADVVPALVLLAFPERVTEAEGVTVGVKGRVVVAAPIAKSGVSAKTSVMLPMFTAWRV